jgi:copper chaperone CopZ
VWRLSQLFLIRPMLVIGAVILAGVPAFATTPKTIALTVDGMVCAFCAQGIERRLRALPATDRVYVNLKDKLVAVGLKQGQDLGDDQLRSELKDAGYDVRAIVRSDEPIDTLRSKRKQ